MESDIKINTATKQNLTVRRSLGKEDIILTTIRTSLQEWDPCESRNFDSVFRSWGRSHVVTTTQTEEYCNTKEDTWRWVPENGRRTSTINTNSDPSSIDRTALGHTSHHFSR